MMNRKAFLLTRQWRDTHDGLMLDVWWATDQGPLWTQIHGQEVVFFVLQQQLPQINQLLSHLPAWRSAQVELKTFHNKPVQALYFSRHSLALEAQDIFVQHDILCWEADIKPAERYLMERFVTASADISLVSNQGLIKNFAVKNPPIANCSDVLWRPKLKVASLDIETSMDAKKLYSIAIWSEEKQIVFMVGEGNDQDAIVFCVDEKSCLQSFFHFFQTLDPDIIIGWSLVQFDLSVLDKLCKKLNVELQLSRAKQPLRWRHEEEDEGGRSFVVIPGRVALDGIDLLKAANHRYTSYSLQNIAEQLLGEGKLLTGAERGNDITALFLQNKKALAEYNLRDCELVWKIFKQEKLVEFAVERSQLTGLLLDRIGGSVAAFEYLYLPRLHRSGYVAPNLGELESDVVSPGGYVLDSIPGIYDNVLVLDFKSLYPSIIRTFLIDPCGYWRAQHQKLKASERVSGFNGAYFAREGHILPALIKQLWQARDKAKQEKNSPLSNAIKIIMNSFYGVLGSTGCRFFDPRIASSITLRGHEIIKHSRDWIEQQGYQVIYGDTDSLFVWLENNTQGKPPKNQQQCNDIGARLARELNQWWKNSLKKDYMINSNLEIQYETHYLRFLMPRLRGSDQGTKKRYAGMIVVDGKHEMVFKGLENVRTDWTELARQFQLELYRRVFEGEDYLDFVRETKAKMLAGECDHLLLYQKRLRQSLADYQKNIPPHAQAAKKYLALTGEPMRRGDWISYVITVNGPEPVGKDTIDMSLRKSAINYQHYIDKQLTPVADSILQFSNQSLEALTDSQLTLFD
jgi:DNA polymerase II